MAASLTEAAPPRPPAAEARPPARKRPRAPRERQPFNTGTAIAVVLILVSALVVLFAGYLFFGSSLQQARTQDVLYDEIQTGLAQATVPVGGVIAPGTPVGVLEIPDLGLEQVIIEGSASEQTISGPGLQLDSVLPGQAGVSVLVGRRATFGAPFAQLDELQIGSRINVTTGQGQFVYVVDVVRTSDAPETQIQSVASRLSLVTSDPAITPSRSLVVSAQLDGEALPASTGVTAPINNQAGKGSTGRGVALLLWSQLLLVVSGLVTWGAVRMPGRALWIGAVPVLVAILWNVFENLAVLLPNNL